MDVVAITSNNYGIAFHLPADAAEVFKKAWSYLVIYFVYTVLCAEGDVYVDSGEGLRHGFFFNAGRNRYRF